MKYIKTFENYSNELKTDSYAIKFLNGEITSLQLENYIFKTNEGVIGDVINWVQEKLIKVLYTFVVTFNKLKTNIISKVLSFITGIMDKIKTFKEKHPILFKGIIIFIIIMIIFLVTESAASAMTVVDGKLKLTNVDEINAAYGFLSSNAMEKSLSTDVNDQQLLFEARLYLKDIIDGKIDNKMTISDQAIEMAKRAITLIQNTVSKSNDKHDYGMLNQVIEYIKVGQSKVLEVFGNTAELKNVVNVVK